MKIFDISRSLSNDLAPWPGDTPFHFELKWKMAEGATVNVGAINMGVHNGTHADAPFHFEPRGETIERMPLDIYIGHAVVVHSSIDPDPRPEFGVLNGWLACGVIQPQQPGNTWGF